MDILILRISLVKAGLAPRFRRTAFAASGAGTSNRRHQRQLGSCDGAVGENAAAESVELGRTAGCVGGSASGFFDELLLLDEPAKIRLVQRMAGERFDRALQ